MKMTKEEAITQLEYEMAMCLFNPITGEEGPLNEDCRKLAEALKIAIQALKEQIADTSSCTHELKILPKWFEDVISNRKNFEIRRNDRDFKVGDFLLLREYERGKYTGRQVTRKIQYIYFGDRTYGLSEDFCILGLQNKRGEVNE